jgi:hypothetical protein
LYESAAWSLTKLHQNELSPLPHANPATRVCGNARVYNEAVVRRGLRAMCPAVSGEKLAPTENAGYSACSINDSSYSHGFEDKDALSHFQLI